MIRHALCATLALVILTVEGTSIVDAAPIDLLTSSRANCVRIVVPSLNSAGTGFFLDSDHILTCFHVVIRIKVDNEVTPPVATFTVPTDAKAILPDGQEIVLTVMAPILPKAPLALPDPLPPALQDLLFPVLADFAVLKLNSKPKNPLKPNPLARGAVVPDVGSDVVFSGYPLESPAMLTHKGMVSGFTPDKAVICLQAPINKGNSGGALLNNRGEVVGIISSREGGISQGLLGLRKYIDNASKQGSVAILGVDQLAVTRELIDTFDKYISTGIGYARSITHFTTYLAKHPEVLK